MITEPRTIVSARKQHRCYWCGEPIEVGTSYVRWCCFDGGDSLSVTVHPECKAAWDRGLLKDRWYYGDEVGYGEHSRGCLCERGRCACSTAGGTP